MADSAGTYEAAGNRMVKQTAVALVQSATLNTFGTAVVVSPAAGCSSLRLPRYLAGISTSTGTETLTWQVVANFSDGTSSTAVTKAGTANTDGTYVFSIADNVNAKTLSKDGCEIISYSISAKSSINSSAAVMTFDIVV